MTDRSTSSTGSTPSAPVHLLAPATRWATIGSITLIFLAAFEALAVTTVMPIVARDLDGVALYALGFSGTLAASVVGMVVAGAWADRAGPVRPLVAAVVVFALGLLAAGLATDMLVFVGARLLQGLGAGATNVALYVVVARVFPAAAHPRIFGAFAAAWVVPSLVGPTVAGYVAERASWHWVFLGVLVLQVAAAGMMLPAIRQLRATPAPEGDAAAPDAWPIARIGAAVVVSVALVGLNLAAEASGALVAVLVALCLAVVVVAARPLLPAGTLRVARGLPSVVLLRGAVAAAFFATEAYLPYLLQRRDGLDAGASGLVLTIGAISWALGSQVQARMTRRLPHARALVVGACGVALGVATQLAVVLLGLHLVVAGAGWLLAAFGMGLVFPRIATLALAHSQPATQGFNSSAVTIADATGGATALALTGVVAQFAGGTASGTGAFAAVFALTTVFALASVVVAARAASADR